MPRAETMRRILLIVGIGLLIGAAAFTALLLVVDVNQFRGPIKAQLQRSLDRPVTLGPMGLSLLPLSIRVADLRIGESPAFRSAHPFVSAKEVHVRAGLLALLKGQVAVHSLRLVQPVVEIIRNENGAWNYSSLGGDRKTESGRVLTISDLQIVDGSIAVTDLTARKPRVVYQHIDLRLRDFAPGQRLDVALTAHLPGSGEQTIALQARGTGLTDLEGRLSLNQVALSALQPFFGSSGASALDAILSGDTDLRTEKGVLLANGKLSMDQARLRGAELGFEIHTDYQLSYDNSRESLEIRSLDARLGGTAVSASGRLNLKATPSQGHLTAALKNASITELARLAGVRDLKGTASAEVRAQGPLDRPETWVWTGSGSIQNGSFSSPAFAKPVGIRSAKIDFRRQASGVNVKFQGDVDEVSLASSGAPSPDGGSASKPSGLEDISGGGKLSIGTIRYGGIVLTQVQAECAIEGGIIRLAPITARLYGGQQSGSIIVDTRRAYPSFAVTTKLDRVDANQFLSATTSLKQTLYGLLATNADVQFAARPGEDLARSLNGSVNLKLHQGSLAGINLMNEVASVGKFLGFRKSGEVATNIVELTGDLKITDGTVRTDNVKMTLEDGSALAAGMMNLADQTLNMRLLVTLHQGLSTQVGGSNIGGFMSTAFGNEKGELMIPVVVSGTFAKPRVTPDAERIAQMKLKSLVPGTSAAPGNVREKVEGLVDLLRGKKKQ